MIGTTDFAAKVANVNGSLNTSLAVVTQQFTDGKTAGDALVASDYRPTEQIYHMTYAKTRLAAARDDAIKAMNDAAIAAINRPVTSRRCRHRRNTRWCRRSSAAQRPVRRAGTIQPDRAIGRRHVVPDHQPDGERQRRSKRPYQRHPTRPRRP